MINEDDFRALSILVADHERRISDLENNQPSHIGSQAGVGISNDGSKTDIILDISNKIDNCEESGIALDSILKSRDNKQKILLCYYMSYKYFSNQWLSSSDIEAITIQLRTKIDKRNIPRTLKILRQYLESSMARKKGAKIAYRLNRRGAQYFEEILNNIESINNK